MKLLGILKEKFDKAKTTEDKKKVLVEAGIVLTDEELDGVIGGKKNHGHETKAGDMCPQCSEPNHLRKVGEYLVCSAGHSFKAPRR